MLSGYSLGFCEFDLPALILLVLILVAIVVHNHKFKKKRDEYNQAIEEKNKQ